MFCSKCGKLVDNDAKFCPYCGSEIEQEEKELEVVEVDNEEEKVEKGPWQAFATVGYILGLVGFILSFFTVGLNIALPGLVFSIMGKNTTDKEKWEKANKGLKFAIAGIIIGTITSIILGIVLASLGYDSFSELIESLLDQYLN